jgi:hypothetical protein
MTDGRSRYQVLVRGVGEFKRAFLDGDERAEHRERFRD